HLKSFRFRLEAAKRKCHRHRGVDGQCQRARRPANLSVGRFGFGAGRLRLQANRVERRARLKTVKAHPIGGRARRESKRATQTQQNSIDHLNHPPARLEVASPLVRIRARSLARNTLRGINLTIFYHISARRRQIADEIAATDAGSSAKWLMTRSGSNSAIGRSLYPKSTATIGTPAARAVRISVIESPIIIASCNIPPATATVRRRASGSGF